MKNKKIKKSFTKNDVLLIKIARLFLFPLYFVGLLLRFYDSIKIKTITFIKYKILKHKKIEKAEDWWII